VGLGCLGLESDAGFVLIRLVYLKGDTHINSISIDVTEILDFRTILSVLNYDLGEPCVIGAFHSGVLGSRLPAELEKLNYCDLILISTSESTSFPRLRRAKLDLLLAIRCGPWIFLAFLRACLGIAVWYPNNLKP
jgi:hypothetical protein